MKNLITISDEIQSGTPVFYNTRVPVKNLFHYMKGGDILEDFLEDFPSVGRDLALKVLDIEKKLMFKA